MNRTSTVVFGVFLLALSGCGDDAEGEKRAWSFATLKGVPALNDVALMDGTLYAVAADNERRIFVADARALQHGASLAMTSVALRVREKSPISGADPFAQEGYNIEHIWDLPASFVGIALRPPSRLYLAERNMRLIYWGDVVRGSDGVVTHARLDWAFTLRGGARTDSAKSDWRDKSAGLVGLTALRRMRKTEDLYAVDLDGGTADLAGLRRLDRTGGQLGATVRITGADGKRPDLRGIVWDRNNERFLALVGEGRGALVPFKDPGARMVRLGAGTPGPTYDGVSGWTAMTTADDGRVLLISEGSPTILAWRAPEAKSTIKPR